MSLKNVQIEKQHAEKEILLQEVHHRVKNNMQIISSLIRLQDQEINYPVVSHVFNQAQQRILAIALIHERMYKASEFASINVQEYFESLSLDIIRQYSNKQEVRCSVNCKGLTINHSNIVPLGLIIHELIANSLIHGLKESGTINVEVQAHHLGYRMTYSDSGVGFTESHKPGFGTNFISILAEQLSGELSVETQQNKGVTYTIDFEKL